MPFETGPGDSLMSLLSRDPKEVMGRSMLIAGRTFQVFAKVLRWTESVSVSGADKRESGTR